MPVIKYWWLALNPLDAHIHLQASDRIVDGIARERSKLDELRSQADIVIDSSNLNVHQLEKRIAEIFSPGSLECNSNQCSLFWL